MAGLVVLVCALLLMAGLARAHFSLDLNTRTFHVEHLDKGLRVYIRLPMAYLVAHLVDPDVETETELPEAPPFTTNTHEDGAVVYYLDVAAVHADLLGLGDLVAQGHQFVSNGQTLQPRVEAVRVYPATNKAAFATLGQAQASFDTVLYPLEYPPAYVNDTIVDVALRYDALGSVAVYQLSSSLNPGLPDQDKTANTILDYYPGGVEVFQVSGLLETPVTISRSPWVAALTFIKEGVRHILEGPDHVLFVLCIALGAASIRSLLSRITGFTLGHSVTLSLGFFGFVPSGLWFVPSVELGIALSIIYAAWIAARQTPGAVASEPTIFCVTFGIGTLHGLGFSFVLFHILQVDSPNVWQSLLAFNVGVEVGQVLIVLVCWPVFRLLARLRPPGWAIIRWSVAAPCIAIATYWSVQRAIMVYWAV